VKRGRQEEPGGQGGMALRRGKKGKARKATETVLEKSKNHHVNK